MNNLFSFLCKSPDTQGLKATSRCGLQFFFLQGPQHLLLGLKRGYPPFSPYGCRLHLGIIHQKPGWQSRKQETLPPQIEGQREEAGSRESMPSLITLKITGNKTFFKSIQRNISLWLKVKNTKSKTNQNTEYTHQKLRGLNLWSSIQTINVIESP